MGLFGTISFILFGQLNNVVTDVDEYFAVMVEALGRQVFDVREPFAPRRRRCMS